MASGAVEQVAGEIGDFYGETIGPSHAGYDSARAVFNGMFDRKPALIARCTGVADVVAAVNFARERDMEIAVRGGGHSVPGYAVCDDGIVIDLTPMKGIWVDPGKRVARAQAGLNWGEFDRETQLYGLATTGGRVTTTGISGLTLGSGSGWLERKFGFTVDNLLAADVVTAQGETIRASNDENEDLFWGLRGGGGNFGIVTSFEYRLHEVGPIVLGGLLAHPRDRAPELLRAWRDYMRQAPDELGGAFAFLTAPPEPFVPEEVRMKPICGLIVLYAGPVEEGQAAVQGLKDLAPPALDLVMPMPYLAVQQLLDAGNPAGRLQYWKSDHTSDLTDDAVDTLVEHANRVTSPFTIVVIEPKGGATRAVDENAVALTGRDAECAYYAIAQWEDPSESESQIQWARDLAAAMDPYASAGIPLNFVMDEGESRVRNTYGDEKFRRLVALKDTYDPDNLFHMNQNISPSAKAAA